MRHQTFKQDGGRYRIVLHQNDGLTLRATLKDDNGDAIDLTGKTIALIAKRSLFDASAAFTITGLVATADEGIVDFRFTTTHTATVADYKAEIEVNSGTGLDETILIFDLIVKRDVG